MSSRTDPERRAWFRGKSWLLGLAEWNGCCRAIAESDQHEQNDGEDDGDEQAEQPGEGSEPQARR